jgi:hypothetical protein
LCCTQDALVCEATLRAIYYLSRNCESNQLRFGVTGAVNLIMAALRTFFFKPQIVYYCCLCIGGLSYHNVINAEQFDDCEVAELLYKVLNMYLEQTEVVEAACYAIYALRDLNHRLADLCKVGTLSASCNYSWLYFLILPLQLDVTMYPIHILFWLDRATSSVVIACSVVFCC